MMRTTALASVLAFVGAAASAATLPGVGTFEGNAGIGTSNGDVSNSPVGNSYVYVTTYGSDYLFDGLGIGLETNGTLLTTNAFSADQGDELQYYFNYVASDGTSSFVEYAYAILNTLDPTTNTITDDALIFTARTTPSGNTVPGFDLPALDSAVTLTPASTPILPGSETSGAPFWNELGGSSGACFGTGCGLTDWIKATLELDAGVYSLSFGVVNWGDQQYDNGLAIAGLTVGGDDIIDDGNNNNPGVVPLPAAAWLMLSGLGLLGLSRRRSAI